MIEIRAKDKVFLAVVLPLALLGCYVGFAGRPLAKERAALLATRAGLPDPDMFPTERRALQNRQAAAEKELAEAQAEKAPDPAVRGSKDDSEAQRLQAVVDVLRATGVHIVKAEPVAADGVCADVLRATGVRPEPVARRLVLEAPYPVLLEALRRFEADRLAVVPGAWSMTPGDASCRWEVTVWL